MARIMDRVFSGNTQYQTTVAFKQHRVFDSTAFGDEYLIKLSTDELRELYEALRAEFAQTSDEASASEKVAWYNGGTDMDGHP